MIPLSVVILTHNDQKRIKACPASVTFAPEIIVIDDFSTDKTRELAKKFTTKVYKRHLADDFSEQRNFGLSKATHEWVLFIDPDEIVSENLADEIVDAISSPDSRDGIFFKRYDRMWGKTLRYGEVGDVRIIRLAKKESGKFEGKVHETWNIRGKTGELINPLYHSPHETIGEFIREINRYSSIRAKELYGKNVKVAFFDIVFFPVGKLILNYVVKLGFMDGIQGLLVAICMSFHSFLVRGKLWMLYDKKEKI